MKVWSLAVALVVLVPSLASAHRGSAKYLAVERTDEGASIEVELEVVDAAMELGLGEEAPVSAVLAQGDALSALLASGIHVEGPSGACTATASTNTP